MRNLALWGAAFAITLVGCSSADEPASNAGQAGATSAGNSSGGNAPNAGSSGAGTSNAGTAGRSQGGTTNAHEEVDTCAGFVAKSFATRMTNAGYTGSPRSEVMAFSGNPVSAIGQWINSVYHRTPLLSPWIGEMGYGMTEDCDTIDMGLGP